MDIEIVDGNTQIEYQIEDIPDEYKEVLLHYGFTEKNHRYTRSYNKNTFMFQQSSRLLKENFEGCLEKMINNTLCNTKMDWEKALDAIADKMLKNNISWWLTGSAACAIRGINIIPQDIDIMTYKTEIKKVEKVFKNFAIEPYHHVTNWVVKGFGVIYLNGRIDMAFEPEESSDGHGRVDFGFYAMNNLETIKWKGYSIKVPPVDLHIYSNKVRGRHDRVKLIEEYIKKKC